MSVLINFKICDNAKECGGIEVCPTGALSWDEENETIKIDNENYKYLQLFDIINNKDQINIEVDNADEIIYNFIEENELDFEKIIKYARETKNKKILEKLYILAR